MPTIYEIVQHVILGEPYEKKQVLPLKFGVKDSLAYKLLIKETSNEILQKIRDFVRGNLSEIKIEIDANTAYQYLAAAKIVDFDTDSSEMTKSTYKIREMALLRSVPQKNGHGLINMANAFSMPPMHKKDLDVLLINEIDNNHSVVNKASFGKERNNHLKRIYTYCQKELEIVPEMVTVIEVVVRKRFQATVKIAEFLPNNTTIVFKGCSGASFYA